MMNKTLTSLTTQPHHTKKFMLQFHDLHLATRRHENFSRYYPYASTVPSSPERKRNKTCARIFALDCEMVMTKLVDDSEASNEPVSTLARASLVELLPNTNTHVPVLDVFVKIPSNRTVTDRLEHVSGITQEHLDEATMCVASVINQLNEIVDVTCDYVIGHSLYNDLSVLPGWEPVHVIETSFLFKINSHPRITLSLKDALMETAGEEIHVDKSSPHDSVQDATACLKICQVLLYKTSAGMFEMDEVPKRFRKQVVFQRFDRSAEPELRKIWNQYTSEQVSSKGFKWQDQYDQGTLCLEFATEELAQECFDKVPVDTANCSEKGFPYNKTGHLRKSLLLNGKHKCELTSHLKIPLNRRMEFKCKQSELGKILGKQGKQILHIQRCSGVLISNKPQGKDAVFEILSDDTAKCEEAFMRMSLAQQGKYQFDQ